MTDDVADAGRAQQECSSRCSARQEVVAHATASPAEDREGHGGTGTAGVAPATAPADKAVPLLAGTSCSVDMTKAGQLHAVHNTTHMNVLKILSTVGTSCTTNPQQIKVMHTHTHTHTPV